MTQPSRLSVAFSADARRDLFESRLAKLQPSMHFSFSNFHNEPLGCQKGTAWRVTFISTAPFSGGAAALTGKTTGASLKVVGASFKSLVPTVT